MEFIYNSEKLQFCTLDKYDIEKIVKFLRCKDEVLTISNAKWDTTKKCFSFNINNEYNTSISERFLIEEIKLSFYLQSIANFVGETSQLKEIIHVGDTALLYVGITQ